MSVIVLVGRIVFSLLFLGSAMGHLMQSEQTAAVAQGRGLPAARALAILTGIQLGVGGLMIAAGAWADLGALILLAFVLPAAFLIHRFWQEEGETQIIEMSAFMKNLALSGALLMLFAFFAHLGPELDFMATDPLFDLDLD